MKAKMKALVLIPILLLASALVWRFRSGAWRHIVI